MHNIVILLAAAAVCALMAYLVLKKPRGICKYCGGDTRRVEGWMRMECQACGRRN